MVCCENSAEDASSGGQWPHRHIDSNLKDSIAQKENPIAPDKVEPDFFAVALHESPNSACVSIVDT